LYQRYREHSDRLSRSRADLDPGKHRAHWFLSGEGIIDSVIFAPGLDLFQAKQNIPKSKRPVLSDTVINKSHVGKRFKYTVAVTLPGGKPIALDPDVEVQG